MCIYNCYNFKKLCCVMLNKFNKCERYIHLKLLYNLVISLIKLKYVIKELCCIKKKKQSFKIKKEKLQKEKRDM